MSLYVVDASVAAKWLVLEPSSEAANLLIAPQHRLLAPDLVLMEITNVLAKRVRRRELTPDEAKQRKDIPRQRITVVPWAVLAEAAFEIALDFKRSFYDSLYLTLALVNNCPIVTADRRLLNGLAGTSLAASVIWIEELPDAESD